MCGHFLVTCVISSAGLIVEDEVMAVAFGSDDEYKPKYDPRRMDDVPFFFFSSTVSVASLSCVVNFSSIGCFAGAGVEDSSASEDEGGVAFSS